MHVRTPTVWNRAPRSRGTDSSAPPPVSLDEGALSVGEVLETIVGCKWSVRLLDQIAAGTRRPSALLRGCPGLSKKVMNERLRKMMRFHILERTVSGSKPPLRVEYRLTPFGQRFLRILREVRKLQEAVDAGRFAARRNPSALRSLRPRPARAQ